MIDFKEKIEIWLQPSAGKYVLVIANEKRCLQSDWSRRVQFKSDLTLRFGSSQLTFTCWKSTIETLEKGVEYVQS